MLAYGSLTIGAALVFGLVFAARHRRRTLRDEEARRLARELLPEIRAILTSCDPAGESRGAPIAGAHFTSVRDRLPRVLAMEAAFAVETFYGCVDAYADASAEMFAAFSKESELSLGDKVRAKDRRDRCLKDVYYSGEGALERLQNLG